MFVLQQGERPLGLDRARPELGGGIVRRRGRGGGCPRILRIVSPLRLHGDYDGGRPRFSAGDAGEQERHLNPISSEKPISK